MYLFYHMSGNCRANISVAWINHERVTSETKFVTILLRKEFEVLFFLKQIENSQKQENKVKAKRKHFLREVADEKSKVQANLKTQA